MGQEATSLYYSPSTTPGGHPFYFTRGTQQFLRSFSLPNNRTSTGSMAPGASNAAVTADGSTTVAGPEYRNGSGSEESIARSIPPPSNFKIYYATAEAENRDFDGWENQLCFPLPVSDIGTCCAAGWIPCYLFGKSNWRLEQLRERKDPSNKSYKSGQGCNIWCWTWTGLQIFGCGWIGTGFQRNRVRATYGIKGTCCSDFVTAYLCNCCVLMQSDREIQAREGRSSFITNKKYDPKEKLKEEASASQQPIPMQQMRYRPNGDTEGPVSITNRVSPPKKIIDPKKLTPFPIQGAMPSHRNSKVGSAYRNAKSEPPHRKTSDFAWSDFSLSSKNKSPITQSIHSPKDLGQSRSGLWYLQKRSDSSENVENAAGSVKPDENSQPGTQTPGTNPEVQHQTDSEQESSRRSSVAMVNNWRHNSVKSSPKRSNPKPNAANSTKMSYVHDFTDCPINKSVLDYYDRQQKRIDENQQQILKGTIPENDSAMTSSSTTPARKLSIKINPKGTPEEAATSTDASSLNDTHNNSAFVNTTSKRSDSHALDNCPQAHGPLRKTSKNRGPVEHRVDQCPRQLDGTSSDIGESSQISVDNGERMTGSPSSQGVVQPSTSKEALYNRDVLENHKQSDDIGTIDIALTTAVMNGTGKPTEKTTEKTDGGHLLDSSSVLAQKDRQWSLDNQQDLRDAVCKAFPDKFNRDGGTPTSQSPQKCQPESRLEHALGESQSQSPHASQDSQPKPTVEHALGETRLNSIVI